MSDAILATPGALIGEALRERGLTVDDLAQSTRLRRGLLEQMEATAGELAKVTDKWNGQLAALAELAGSPAAAAELSGLPKADIEAAVKASDKATVDAAVEAAKPATRRRRAPSSGAGPADGGTQTAGATT